MSDTPPKPGMIQNRFGSWYMPLSDKQKADLLTAFEKGTMPTQAARDAGCTVKQATAIRDEYRRKLERDKGAVIDRLLQDVAAMQDLMAQMVAQMAEQSRQMSKQDTHLKIIHKACERRKLEQYSLRSERQQARRDRIALKQALWKATARKV